MLKSPSGTKYGGPGITFGEYKKRVLAYVVVQRALFLYFSALAKHIGCIVPICGLCIFFLTNF